MKNKHTETHIKLPCNCLPPLSKTSNSFLLLFRLQLFGFVDASLVWFVLYLSSFLFWDAIFLHWIISSCLLCVGFRNENKRASHAMKAKMHLSFNIRITNQIKRNSRLPLFIYTIDTSVIAVSKASASSKKKTTAITQKSFFCQFFCVFYIYVKRIWYLQGFFHNFIQSILIWMWKGKREIWCEHWTHSEYEHSALDGNVIPTSNDSSGFFSCMCLNLELSIY